MQILQIFSLILSFWGVITSTIFRNNLLIWIFTEFIGFLIIIVIGAIFSARYPSMLYSLKGKDISTLFIFQFISNYEKYIRDPKSLNLSQRSRVAYKIADT